MAWGWGGGVGTVYSAHVLLPGVASTVRRQRGVPSWGWSYRQQAIVTAVRTADPAFIASSAIQRFTPEGGCVALLPSVAGFLSLV